MKNVNIKQNFLFVLISFVMIIFSYLSVNAVYNGNEGEEITDDECLTFTAEKEESKISFSWASGSNVQYKKNDEEWTDYTEEISLDKGDSVKFKGQDVTTNESNHFNVTGEVSASGCVDSLRLDVADKFQGLSNSCYNSMFYQCEGLKTAPKLLATALAENCYQSMFQECKNLEVVPDLSASNLKSYCYYYMFKGCSSLIVAPELNSTSIAKFCYNSMFEDCTSLTIAYAIPKKDQDKHAYDEMFEGCLSLKSCVFKKKPSSWENDYFLPGNPSIERIILDYEGSNADITSVKSLSWGENAQYFVYIDNGGKRMYVDAVEDYIVGSDFPSFFPQEEKEKVKFIRLKNSPKEIKKDAFEGFYNNFVIFDETIYVNVSDDTIIDSSLVQGFESMLLEGEKDKIKYIEFGKSPSGIQNGAFSYFKNLQFVVFDEEISQMTWGTDPLPSIHGAKEMLDNMRKKQLESDQ